MKISLLIFTLLASSQLFSQDSTSLQESAKNFMKHGDYSHAASALEKAIIQEPENLDLHKDLAINYMILRKNNSALEQLLPFIENGKADDQTYQLTANIYNLLDQAKESENIYKKGIRKFPASGALYNEYGMLLFGKQDLNALKMWEKGIENDPQFPGNYYNAAKSHNFNANSIWQVIYGEIFLLLEPGTARTAEIKNIVSDGYRNLLTDEDILSNLKGKSAFEKAYLQIVSKEKRAIVSSVNTDNLTMFRTRFLLDWNNQFSKKYPLSLFQIQTSMLEEGLFEAYNEWLFGTVQNLAAYQTWISVHPEEYEAFSNYQKGRIFKFLKSPLYH